MLQEIAVHSIPPATEVDDHHSKQTSVHSVRSLPLGFVICPQRSGCIATTFFGIEIFLLGPYIPGVSSLSSTN